MPQQVEEAVKVLGDFEAQLDKIKAEASETKKRLVKTASQEAEKVKADVISMTESKAAEALRLARESAEREADQIEKKGETSLNQFRASISRRKNQAVDLVLKQLLGN